MQWNSDGQNLISFIVSAFPSAVMGLSNPEEILAKM